MFKHVLFTWLLANLLHPLILTLAGLFHFYKVFVPFSPGGIMFAVDIMLVSLPCLLMGYILLIGIAGTAYTVFARFCIWFVAAISLVALETLVFMCFMSEYMYPVLFTVAAPLLVAAGLATVIRYRQFTELFISPQPVDHETNLE